MLTVPTLPGYWDGLLRAHGESHRHAAHSRAGYRRRSLHADQVWLRRDTASAERWRRHAVEAGLVVVRELAAPGMAQLSRLRATRPAFTVLDNPGERGFADAQAHDASCFHALRFR